MEDRHQKTAYPLRMPDDMRSRLEKSASAIGRSLNAEIVARLEQSLSDSAPSTIHPDTVKALVDAAILEIEQRIGGPRTNPRRKNETA